MTKKHTSVLIKEAIKLLEPKLPVMYPHLDIKLSVFAGKLDIQFKPKRYNTGISKNVTTISNRIGLFKYPFYSVNANIIHTINECIQHNRILQIGE